MTPKDVHIPILEPVDMTLYGGRNLACVIKLKVLGWGDSPSGTDVVTEVLISEIGRCDNQLERHLKMLHCWL